MSDRLPIDDRIDAALRAGRDCPVAGFPDRALAAVSRHRRRARILAFVPYALAAAACLTLAFPIFSGLGRDAEAERLAHAVAALEMGLPSLDDADALAAFVVSGN